MPTIVGILTFISMINTTSERLKARNFFICRYFSFYEQLKFRAQLSWAWKKFYNLAAENSLHAMVFFLLIFCHLYWFFFFQNKFKNTISGANSLDPDQARICVGPDLGYKLFAKAISRRQKMRPTQLLASIIEAQLYLQLNEHLSLISNLYNSK